MGMSTETSNHRRRAFEAQQRRAYQARREADTRKRRDQQRFSVELARLRGRSRIDRMALDRPLERW